MEVNDNFVSVHKVFLGLASAFGPSSASFFDVLLDFPDATISAGCWKTLGFDANDLGVKIVSDGRHVIAIDGSEKLLERFDCGFHAAIIAMPDIGPKVWDVRT